MKYKCGALSVSTVVVLDIVTVVVDGEYMSVMQVFISPSHLVHLFEHNNTHQSENKKEYCHTQVEPHPTTIRNRVPVLHSEKHRQQQQSGEQNR